MSNFKAALLFPNYSKISNPLPPVVWTLLRAGTFAVFAGVIGLLFVMPELGLKLFWGLIIPLVPAIVVIAPGLWRQICPFALSNQIPRMLKVTLQRDLPEFAADKAFAIAVMLFVALVALRVPVFNSSGPALAAMLIGALAAALIGGFVFKGRSGWCGTFCPLGPIQRHYGQAPTLVVPNGLCPTCVGCQKNCYDFNPQATVFDDVYDEDPRHAGQRRFFMGMMPGMILGYFLQLPVTESYPHYLFELLGATLASAAAYHFVTSFFGLNPYRTAALFGAAALVIFYFFAGAIIVNTVSSLLAISVPEEVRYGAQSLGVLVAGALLFQGWKNERVFETARGEAETKAAQEAAEAMASSGFEVIDHATGAVFHAKGGQSLLSAIQGNGLDISASCCSGLCGSDPVAILEGEENLSPPTEDELQTLRRLGLGAQTRLACCCQVLGPVRINRDVAQSEVSDEPTEEISEAYRQRFDLVARVSPLLAPDRRRPIGATRIVIIGNGIGAITTAETLRAGDAAIHITLLSVEPHAFYNRMAIAKIVDGRGTVDDLTVLPASWYDEHRINVRLGTRVASIDREQRSVTLMTGESIPYDRLVLATGARSGVPTPMFLAHRNAFVVRSAGDAQALVDYIRRTKARSAVVVGGGVLGVEATEALRDFGVGVTLVHRGAYLMDRQLDREGAFVLQSYLERRGIQVITNAKIKSWQGAATYSSVLLEDGRVIDADVFVASTGNVTNSELARGCGLNVRRGIVVDAQMRTSDAAIYAVGDVAEFNGLMTGLWSTAIAQARVAAATILGTADQFVPEKSLVTLKSNGIELFSYGDPHHSAEGCEVVMGPLFNQAWWRLHVRDGQIDMAIYAGPNGSADHVRRLLKSQLPINDYLPQLREGNLDVLRKARRA